MDETPSEGVAVPNGTDVEMKEEPISDTTAIPPSLPTQPSIPDAAAATATTPTPATPSAAAAPQAAAAPPVTTTPASMPAARSSPAQTATPAPPSQASAHGSPTRVYLNQNVTPHLLEAMKYLAVHEPEKPLKWLADFLAQRSTEVEGA